MAISGINPLDFPLDWNRVTVAGLTWGLDVALGAYCIVSGADREYKYDVKEGKGTKGATTTFTNVSPAKFQIKYFMWAFDHFVGWDVFVLLHRYDPTKKAAQAYDIYHPALAANEIKSVVTAKIGQPNYVEGGEGMGMTSITVDYLEYFPAGKSSAVSTPNGSSGNAPKWVPAPPAGDKPDPIAEAQQQVDELGKQAQGAGK